MSDKLIKAFKKAESLLYTTRQDCRFCGKEDIGSEVNGEELDACLFILVLAEMIEAGDIIISEVGDSIKKSKYIYKLADSILGEE